MADYTNNREKNTSNNMLEYIYDKEKLLAIILRRLHLNLVNILLQLTIYWNLRALKNYLTILNPL